MVLGANMQLESLDPAQFIHKVEVKKQTHSYTFHSENCTHSYTNFQILAIHILFW